MARYCTAWTLELLNRPSTCIGWLVGSNLSYGLGSPHNCQIVTHRRRIHNFGPFRIRDIISLTKASKGSSCRLLFTTVHRSGRSRSKSSIVPTKRSAVANNAPYPNQWVIHRTFSDESSNASIHRSPLFFPRNS